MGKGEIFKNSIMVNQRKRNIVTKLCECFTKYNQVVVVSLDNVSTNQIHAARKILAEGEHKGEMIIGKNSLIRKALKFVTEAPQAGSDDYEDHKNWKQNPKLECLKELMGLNVGLIFSEEPYNELRVKIEAQKISMPARTGVLSPTDVVIAPNSLSVPQFIANGFKTMLAIGSESGYSFRQLEDALSAAQNVAATTTVAADNKADAKVEEAAPAQDESESEDMDMGGLFD